MGAFDKDVEKPKYPKSVFFIVSNEFCERFSFYGMRTILSIYITDMLLYSESDAKIIFHAFTVLVYFFPLFGAMLADSYLGKFKTIFYVSIVYACGNIILALAATKPIGLPPVEFTMIGLLLIAIGTGGIKPCVAAFGGDQFTLPQQTKQLAAFFSMFYFAINSGSFVSTFLTPVLREQECFGGAQCFTLAFGVPGVLMIISIIIFGLGKPLYKIKEPEGNMVIQVSKCIGNAISEKSKSKEKKEHWLDHAIPEYGESLVKDVKALLRVLILYIPLPVFWALFDQQGTGWTFMARRMDGDIGFYTILPDQIQVINPLLVMFFIPLFDMVVYPMLTRCKVLRTPLQRLVMGGLLAAIAFAMSAGISMVIESETPILPRAGTGQVTFYNIGKELKLTSPTDEKINITVPEMGYVLLDESVTGSITKSFLAGDLPIELTFEEKTTMGYYLSYSGIQSFTDSFAKSEQGLPIVRTLIRNKLEDRNYEITYILGDMQEKVTKKDEPVALKKPGEYSIKIGEYLSQKIEFKLGGVYTVLVDAFSDTQMNVVPNTITPYNRVHMLWIIPQYVVITVAEIMFSITGLEFSYSQAPLSMKSVLQAGWLLTTCIGNLIVVIIEAIEPFEKQSNNFFLYAALMLIDMVIFALMAMRYKYVKQGDTVTEDDGIENIAFSKSNETKMST
ncbi:peptide transporter family 1-like isoform X2 [Atheta coriaria]|uniref:peptide transporter family 1-like isoform X2 n=1 Tax=Dalotia coriaria TaxID=877792 RepID=UPI0031F3AC2A